MFVELDRINAFNTTCRSLPNSHRHQVYFLQSESGFKTRWALPPGVVVMRPGVGQSARSMRSHPPQSETHAADSRAFLAHPKAMLILLVKRRATVFVEGSTGSSGLSGSLATIDQQPVSKEQRFHEILLS